MLIPLFIALTSLAPEEACPEPGDVERRVRSILHLSDAQRLSESFIVQRREAGLYVELRGADSTSIGERSLPSEGSCDELAQAAAVVLSAWLSDVHPDFAPELPATAVFPEAPAATPPPPAPPEEPPKPRPEERRDTPPSVRFEPVRGEPIDVDLGVGVGVADDLAFLASMSAAYVTPRGWGGRVTALLDTRRRAALGGGSVSWRRWPLALGPTWRVRTDGLFLDLTLAPALSWVRVAGSNFDPARTGGGLTWAGTFDARLASRGRLAWFVAAHGQAYFAESSAYVGAEEYVLPRYVFSFLVGGRVIP